MAHKSLICSDVDGTLLGDHAALVSLAQWLEPRRAQIKLVYNSGRSIDSLRQAVTETPLPEPDALVGCVGTEIELFQETQPLADWPNIQGNWSPQAVTEALLPFEELEPQPEIFHSPYKVSYFVYDADASDLAHWQQALRQANLDVQLVYSSDRDLDVLPQGVHKGSAAAHLAKLWQIDHEQVIVCGDTGNDLTMFEQGFYGIVVGNALAELKALNSDRIYHARGEIAAGVQEGLEHWLNRTSSRAASLSS